jgi:CRISPR-associated protein Cas4
MGPIMEKTVDILFREWTWEISLLQKSKIDSVFPVKLEEHVKIPPGIYGMADGILMQNDQPYPVEYKTWKSNDFKIDRFQLAAYCIGIGYRYRSKVQKGILQFSSIPQRIEITIQEKDEKLIRDVYEEIMLFLETQQTYRKPTDKNCQFCGYVDCQYRGRQCGQYYSR